MKHSKKILAGALTVALTAPMGAMATNGYFSHGYGVKSSSMGGAGVAHPQDTLAAAVNPAGMVHVGNRADVNATLFNPNRENTQNGSNAGTTKSANSMFLIPQGGYNMMLDNNTSFGISVFANGGMNTSYRDNNGVFGPVGSKLGVDLAQLIISPTWSKKYSNNHSVGVSLVLAHQRFKSKGLGNFSGYSNAGTKLSDKGYDSSSGWGVRIGWMGEINSKVTIGATYASKVFMSEFDEYAGLFAEQGDFDIPANYAVGVTVKATPKLTVAFDIERILYDDVASISNPIAGIFNCPGLGGADSTYCLGGNNGAGFGWDNQTVYKLGIEYQHNKNWVLRGGLNYGEMPYENTEVDFNILAPATVETHLTLGATYSPNRSNEIDFGYMHAFSNDITGTSSFGLNSVTHEMDQNAFFVNYSWKL